MEVVLCVGEYRVLYVRDRHWHSFLQCFFFFFTNILFVHWHFENVRTISGERQVLDSDVCACVIVNLIKLLSYLGTLFSFWLLLLVNSFAYFSFLTYSVCLLPFVRWFICLFVCVRVWFIMLSHHRRVCPRRGLSLTHSLCAAIIKLCLRLIMAVFNFAYTRMRLG